VLSLGVPDRYISHGQREQLLERCGLSSAALAETAEEFCAAAPPFRIIRAAT
jgi:deoxyxylulose-5-phosphate synthase